MKRTLQVLGAIVLFLMIGFLLVGIGGLTSAFAPSDEKVEKNAILAMDLDGVIMDTRDFLELLRKYRKDPHIKGVLIRVNSPGGVVGPSQELYSELKRTREEFKKPVIAYCSGVMASGAYYAAVGADKIFTTPGCMMGSIGALMEFANLSKLYEWAKVQRYSITTGKFKDAGADFKPLTQEQHDLFQDMLNDVLSQFKAAVIEGRKMKPEVLSQYADGRIFTGAWGVHNGFADTIGTWDDARKLLGEMTGLGANAEVFKAKKRRPLLDMFEDSAESRFKGLKGLSDELLQTELTARPLFLMPGVVRF